GVRDGRRRQALRAASSGGAVDTLPQPRTVAHSLHGQAPRQALVLFLFRAGVRGMRGGGTARPEPHPPARPLSARPLLREGVHPLHQQAPGRERRLASARALDRPPLIFAGAQAGKPDSSSSPTGSWRPPGSSADKRTTNSLPLPSPSLWASTRPPCISTRP